MSSQELTAITAILISLALSYVPGLAPRWDALEPTTKRLIVLGLMLLSSAAIFGLACAGWAADLGFTVTCDKAGLIGLLKGLVIAIVASQSVYQISPKPRYSRAR